MLLHILRITFLEKPLVSLHYSIIALVPLLLKLKPPPNFGPLTEELSTILLETLLSKKEINTKISSRLLTFSRV
jgi:hypothetical protein